MGSECLAGADDSRPLAEELAVGRRRIGGVVGVGADQGQCQADDAQVPGQAELVVGHGVARDGQAETRTAAEVRVETQTGRVARCGNVSRYFR